MGEEKLEKDLQDVQSKYSSKKLHHYQDQPEFSRWEKVWTVMVEWLQILVGIVAIGASLLLLAVLWLVIESVTKGCGS